MRKYEWIDYLVQMLVALSALTSGIVIGRGMHPPIERVEQVASPAPVEEPVEKPSQISWKTEKPTGIGLPPMEDRILNELREYGEPMWVSSLSIRVTVGGGDEEFYPALESLWKQGKVVRIAERTPTKPSVWALPKEE